MIYITTTDSIDTAIPEKYRNYFDILKKTIYFIRCKSGKILEEKIDNRSILILPNLSKQILEKVNKIIKVRCIKNVCLSEQLLQNEEFVEFVKGQGVNVLDGRWLFYYLVPKLVDYVAQNKKESVQEQEISILVNKLNDVIVHNIDELASMVKVINIVTTKEKSFKGLEEKIYEEKGIILNVSRNYKKSLVKSDIIINFDFDEELMGKYVLPKKACVINLQNEVKVASKSFEGINTSFYQIAIPKKYIKYYKVLKDFNESSIYESFIYKRTNPKNIMNEIDKDGVYVTFLEGANGRIRKSEFTKMSKKAVAG